MELLGIYKHFRMNYGQFKAINWDDSGSSKHKTSPNLSGHMARELYIQFHRPSPESMPCPSNSAVAREKLDEFDGDAESISRFHQTLQLFQTEEKFFRAFCSGTDFDFPDENRPKSRNPEIVLHLNPAVLGCPSNRLGRAVSGLQFILGTTWTWPRRSWRNGKWLKR
jgi:hypothetical protein